MDDAGAIRRLRVSGAIAVLTIALLTIASAAFMAWRYSGAPTRNDLVNRSALRRGQSVAVTYRAERLARFPNEIPQLDKAIATLEASQKSLKDLSATDQAFYRQFIDAAKAVAAHPRDNQLRDALESLGPTMYDIYYKTTIGYAADSSAQRVRSFRATMTASGVTLVILGLLYVFVIRPGERVVAKSVRKLEERRQRFAAMFDNSSEMMAVYDSQGFIVRGNSSGAEQLGFGPDMIGKHYTTHVAPQDQEMVANAFAQATQGRASEVGVSFVDASGREIPVLASLSPITVRGTVVGVVGSARDMTSERQFERELLRGRERFRSLFEASPNAIVAFTADGIITEVNVATERLSGYRAEDLIGKNVTMLLAPEFRDSAAQRIESVLGGEARSYHLDLLARDGTSVSLQAEILPIRIDGRSEGAFLIGKDLTREEALARLDQRDERMRSLYRIASSPDVAASSQIDEALSLGAQALGMEYAYVSHVVGGVATIEHRIAPDALLPMGASIASVPSIGKAIVESPRTVAVNDMTLEPYATELRERELPWKSYIGSRVTVEHAPYGVLVFLSNAVREPAFEQSDRDFIDLMGALIGSALGRLHLQAELSKMAFHDTLTGLPNRALLEEHLGRAVMQSQRTRELVAIHYLDLNRFKPVNDEYGHAAGDQVLREAARRFAGVVRAHDVVARIGGDEFVVLQTGVREDEPIRQLAQRLRNVMNERFVLSSGINVSVGVSVGTAIYPHDAVDAAGLLRAADAAMYGEKSTRRKAG
jgi:diguanylate cyclase (GGDEF)-like protein/PAS domain S-box-containing protein